MEHTHPEWNFPTGYFIVNGKQPLFSTQQMSLDNKLSSKVLELCKIFNLLSIHLHQHMQGKKHANKVIKSCYATLSVLQS